MLGQYLQSNEFFQFACCIRNAKNICCPSKPDRNSEAWRKHNLYANGVKRYFQELDVVNLLQTVRMSKIYMNVMMNQKQRMLFSLQRTKVVSSDATDVVQSDNNAIIKELSHPNQEKTLDPVFALGKLNRALRTYEDERGTGITKLDRRLLKGFYTAD